MKVEIFYHAVQQAAQQFEIAEKLVELIRTNIYSGLNPTMRNVMVSKAEEVAEQYVKLLQAAVPPSKRPKLNIRNIPLLKNQTTMEYVTSYVSNVERAAITRIVLQEVFFPVVAMHDRMVLVPRGTIELINAKTHIFSSLKTWHMRVEEVDFNDSLQVKEALIRIGQRLREETIRDLRAYAAHTSVDMDDLSQAAEHLDIEVGFLRHLSEGN